MNAFQCLRVAARPATTARSSLRPAIERVATSSPAIASQTRSISLLSARRPMLASQSSTTSPWTSQPTSLSAFTPDLVPPPSTHPALNSVASQIRCGPRDTYDPSHFVRKRRHGIETRFKTRLGRKTLMRRLKKGRWNLAHFEGEWKRVQNHDVVNKGEWRSWKSKAVVGKGKTQRKI